MEEPRFDRHRRADVLNSVLETWLVSMDRIRQENPCAYKIMHIIAYFNHQDILFELITAAARSVIDEDTNMEDIGSDVDGNESNQTMYDKSDGSDVYKCSESGSEDDDDILEAATRLTEFLFLRLRKSKKRIHHYDMHKLVQGATRYSLGKRDDERLLFSKKALKIMLDVFPRSSHNTRNRCEMLLPHTLVVSAWPEISQEGVAVAKLLSEVSLYLHHQGRSREQEPIDLKALKMQREVLGKRYPDTIMSLANVAATYRQQGQYTNAEKIGVEVHQFQKDLLGERHPNTTESMANLVSTYYQRGRFRDAEKA